MKIIEKKVFRVYVHGLVLLMANDVSIIIILGVLPESYPSPALGLFIFIVLPIVLFLIWRVLCRILPFLRVLALQDANEFKWTLVASTVLGPMIYLVYFVQGYAPDIGIIITVALLFQLPVNGIAILVARKAIQLREDDDRPYRRQPLRTFGCITFIILGTGLLVLSHIYSREMQVKLAVERKQNRQLKVLDAARELWDTRSFSDYQLRVDISYWSDGNMEKGFWNVGGETRFFDIGELVESCVYDVKVNQQSVTATLQNTCTSYVPTPFSMTVTDLFNEIEQSITRHSCGPNGCRCDGYIGVDVTYNTRYGYPQTIKESFKDEVRLFIEGAHWPPPLGCTLVGIMTALPEYKVEYLSPIP